MLLLSVVPLPLSSRQALQLSGQQTLEICFSSPPQYCDIDTYYHNQPYYMSPTDGIEVLPSQGNHLSSWHTYHFDL